MFKISKQLDYAFQLINSLSRLDKGKLLNLRTFSQESNISFYFLQRIAKQLREAGIIGSVRGVSGGYFLKKSMNKISVKRMMEIVDGNSTITRCMKANNKICDRYNCCGAKKPLKALDDKISLMLENCNLSDLVSA